MLFSKNYSMAQYEFYQKLWDGNGYVHPYKDPVPVEQAQEQQPKKAMTPEEYRSWLEREKALWRRDLIAKGYTPESLLF